MRLALAQLNMTGGDLQGNSARILDSYRRAVAAGVTLMLTPELALTGYPPRDLLAKRRFVQDNLRALDELAAQIGETAVLVGYVDINPDRPGRDYLNAAALLHRGQIVARRFKTLLPTYDVFDEDRYFQPAESSTVVEWEGEKLALTICEDIWNTQGYWPNRLYRRDPVEELVATGRPSLLLNISASPFHLGKAALRQDVLRAVAVKHRVPLVYCNLVGGNDELVFDGQSLVVDASGNILAQGAAFQEDLLIVDLETAQPVPVPAVAPVTAVHDALVLGLRDYVRKCGFKSVVLGLSGGIDSAVTACLAAVGYCTLYGDMNGGLGVIADVPKTLVYAVAGYINRDREIIPQASITKPPSAELRPNQTDQDSLPPYDVLDAILKRYVEESKSTAEIVAETGYDMKLVRAMVRKIDLNEYKRKQAPPCLRVTTKAFGIGRRVPIAQRYIE